VTKKGIESKKGGFKETKKKDEKNKCAQEDSEEKRGNSKKTKQGSCKKEGGGPALAGQRMTGGVKKKQRGEVRQEKFVKKEGRKQGPEKN